MAALRAGPLYHGRLRLHGIITTKLLLAGFLWPVCCFCGTAGTKRQRYSMSAGVCPAVPAAVWGAGGIFPPVLGAPAPPAGAVYRLREPPGEHRAEYGVRQGQKGKRGLHPSAGGSPRAALQRGRFVRGAHQPAGQRH